MAVKTFFNRNSTVVTALFNGASPEEITAKIHTAAAAGAEGIAVDLNKLPPEYRTKEVFSALIAAAPLPFMFLCYRSCQWYGNDDAKRQESLLTAAEAGAEVIDVMGDLYAPCANELTLDMAAVKKQQELIDNIHLRNAKVLISSHMHNLPPMTAPEIIKALGIQAERGADICKIVTCTDTEAGFLEAIKADIYLAENFPKPFIHLSNGKFSKLHRFIGTKLGLAVTFGVTSYADPAYTQPLITSFKQVRDLIPWEL